MMRVGRCCCSGREAGLTFPGGAGRLGLREEDEDELSIVSK